MSTQATLPQPAPQPTSPSPSPSAQQTQQANSNNDLSRTASSAADKHYDFPLWRKCTIVFATSWATLAATLSSTSLFSAAQEIAEELGTTAARVNVSTAGLLLAMAFSSFVWGPVNFIVGRRIAYNACILVLLAFTLGAALAPTFPVFVAMRVLAGLQGTAFHVMGQTILAEYFPPTQRGTATGFFLAGTVIGPPLGPCLAGIIVTYRSWRVILWLQVAMAGMALVLSVLFIPYPKVEKGEAREKVSIREQAGRFNPMRVFGPMSYPDVLFTDLTCGLLSWTYYSILAAPRQILDTQFNIRSPLVAGLFYIAPAVGFLAGTIIGGKFSDMTVKKWIVRRDGVRLSQDRLRSGMVAFFFIIPVSSLVYGWCIDRNVGGLPLAIVSVVFVGVGLMIAFASINTYCAEVMPNKRIEIITGKYCIQYIFSATSAATTGPLFERIGIGPAVSIGVAFVLFGGVLTLLTAKHGRAMHDWWESRKR